MGGHDQSQVKNKSLKSSKKSKFIPKDIPKSHNDDTMTRSLRYVDALLLMLCVREVQNFEWWERSVVAEEVPAQDLGKDEPQQDCFGMLVAQ